MHAHATCKPAIPVTCTCICMPLLVIIYILFTDSYPAATVCQETASPQQEAAGGRLQKQAPIQETQQLVQMPDLAEDKLHRDSAGEDRSSTGGEAQREDQPQAVSCRNTLHSSRYSMTRKSLKQRRELLENIQEEISPSQDDEKCNSGTGSLKRTASTASTVSHDSLRSSGYYSNPRTSILRLSTAESFAENDDDQEEDGALLGPVKQTHRDGMKDEGVVMNIHHMSDFRDESCESSGTESSSPPSSPSKIDEMAELAAEEQDDLQPILRERCNQMSCTPSHKRRLPKQNNILHSDHLSPEHSEMRRRSSSLPTTTRTSYVQAQKAAVCMPGIGPQSPLSHSSSTSLDSETTFGSPSEQSSMNGSQLSLASASSGKWLIYLMGEVNY